MDRKEINMNFITTLFQMYPDMHKMLKDNTLSYTLDSGGNERKITIIYEPDHIGQWTTYVSSKHDGTLVFTFENIIKLINNILQGIVYYKPTAPENYEENFWDYDLTYTVGDINVEFCNNDDSESPAWMGEEIISVQVSIDLERRGKIENK